MGKRGHVVIPNWKSYTLLLWVEHSIKVLNSNLATCLKNSKQVNFSDSATETTEVCPVDISEMCPKNYILVY